MHLVQNGLRSPHSAGGKNAVRSTTGPLFGAVRGQEQSSSQTVKVQPALIWAVSLGMGMAENFFHLLKRERIRKHIYATRQEARRDVFSYIEMFYNRRIQI